MNIKRVQEGYSKTDFYYFNFIDKFIDTNFLWLIKK